MKQEQAEVKKKAAPRPNQFSSVLLYVGGIVSGVGVTILIMCWLNAEAFKDYAAGWQSIATIAALGLGGWWTYSRFIQFREGKPKIDLTLAMVFIQRQGSQWIITVEALLENKAKVRHEFKDFTFEIRYTLPEDELQNKKLDDDITLSAEFPHIAAKGSWLKDAEDPDDRLDYGALEPGESVRWIFIACVPKNATMVRAYSELFDEESEESHESIKVLAVPRSFEKG